MPSGSKYMAYQHEDCVEVTCDDPTPASGLAQEAIQCPRVKGVEVHVKETEYWARRSWGGDIHAERIPPGHRDFDPYMVESYTC